MVDKSLTPGGLGRGRRIYAIGDVHGHRERLERVHARIRADLAARPVPRPLIVHLGDLVDRGPDSAGCLALLARGSPVPGVPVVNLMGNHEWMMLRALEHGGEDADRWLDSGGDASLRSWGLRSVQKPREWLAGIPAAQLALVGGMARSWTVDGYVFVHAGVRPGVPMARQREADLLWIRDSFLAWTGVMLPEAPERVIVHGHTPGAEVVVRANRVGLDTGAGKGRALSCGVFEGEGEGEGGRFSTFAC